MPFKDLKTRKEKHKEYSKRWYEQNKELVLTRNRVRKDKYRKAWTKYKATKSCTKCGMSHPAVIDFHHVIRENKQAVPLLIRQGRYSAAIREAEDKCIPLCANCHRMLHWKEHKRSRMWDWMVSKTRGIKRGD